MSSTYSSNLRIELIGSGDQAGAWGATTDSNLAYILDTAVAGYQAVPITSTSQALTYVNGPSSTANLNQAVYAMLKFTGATAATSVYIPPASKQYIVYNNSGYTITIYNSTVIGNTTAAGTGISVVNGDKIMVWSDATNVFDLQAQNLTSTLAIAKGGTGQTTQQAAINALTGAQTNNRVLRSDGTNSTLSQVVLTTDVTGTLPVANGGTGVTASTGTGSVVLSSGFTITSGTISSTTINSSTLVTPALGTPTSGTLTNCTFPTLNQNTTGSAASAATVTGNATGSTFGFNSGYGSVATAYGCRAWVRFDAAGTIAASGNVTSVTKNATGDYTINFTTAMPDANYAASIVSQSNGGVFDASCVKDGTAPTTAALRVFNCSATTGAGRDPQLMYVAVFR